MPAGFRPADYLTNPKQFGRDLDAEWKPYTDAERPRVATSYLQHRVACAVRDELGARRTGYTLAERLGCPDRYDHIRRKLNGHIPLNLPELHNWALTLGVHILPSEPANLSDMLPAPAGWNGT
jgi:hypothetical protein